MFGCYLLDHKPFCINGEIKKIVLSRNLSLNMPKNALFLFKIIKIAKRWVSASRPPCLRRGGGAPPAPPPNTLPFVFFFFFFDQRPYILVIIAGVHLLHQAFGSVKKKLCYILYATDYGNYTKVSVFFVLSPPPHSFCSGAAPERECKCN